MNSGDKRPVSGPPELTWSGVGEFFETFGCVRSGDPEMPWYEESWGALARGNRKRCGAGNRIRNLAQAQDHLPARHVPGDVPGRRRIQRNRGLLL